MSEDKEVKPKKVSLEEFHAWLEGVEEMQAADWAPNQDQWKTIRGKIDNIVVSEKVVKQPVQRVASAPQPHHSPAPAGPSMLENLEPNAPKPQMVDGRIKTPNIDSSDGYKSGFV